MDRLSVVIPARNEAASIRALLHELSVHAAGAEVIVVDDGSTDTTAAIARQAGARVIHHPYPLGNGGAIKAGAREAAGELIVFMDGDGQHDPADIPRLLEPLEQGFDMVVGARGNSSQASPARRLANRFYNWLASYMTGQHIADLTSGFRAVRAEKFRQFLYLLPNGFSYPTTSTMAFFRIGYPVAYVPIVAEKRIGDSHIRPIMDGLRFLLIIFKIGTLYSPLKLFAPAAALHFILGIAYYIFTFSTQGRLSSMTVFMLTAGITVLLIGLVSEQITQLLYTPTARGRDRP